MTDAFQPHPYFERHMNVPCSVDPIMSEPKTAPPVSSGAYDREQAASYAAALHEETIARPMREQPLGGFVDDVVDRARRILAASPFELASVAEPEGYDDHLDAIERGVVQMSGAVSRSARVAFVPKGGA